MNGISNAPVYDSADQMIVAAAHQIQDSDAVYVGLGLPMLAALLAKYTHAPHCTIIIENGIIRTTPFPLPAATDTLGTQTFSDQMAGLLVVNSLGQGGFINLGFIGAGQIDRHGNVNDTAIGDLGDPIYRFPGGGGGNDVMSFCQRTAIIIRQTKRRFPAQVDYNTCPGYLDGKAKQRESFGLRPNTGPGVVITDLGCYGFYQGEMILQTIHSGCGITLDKIKAEVGWELLVSDQLKDTIPPSKEEIAILREKVDPNKIWSGGKRSDPVSL
jgi:acyl CoA:acetate/3-ketoacid CoA transferase beta subunit